MPTRTISTRLAIEGEAAYKQAVASINNELKTMNSTLKLVEAEYKNNTNSMEALSARGSALADMQAKQKQKVEELQRALENAQKAQQAYNERTEEAKAKINAVEKELSELANSSEDTTQRQAELREELDRLNAELSEAESYQAAAAKGANEWERQLNNAKVAVIDLDEEVEKNEKYLNEAKNSADKCATSIDKYGQETKKAGEKTEEFGNKSKEAVDALASALAAAGIGMAIREITQALQECTGASIAFESAIAGVYKTVDGTPEQLAAIKEGIKQMSTEMPATTTQISAVGEAAGQLGIATDNVLDFTRVMIDLGESTNLSADKAASALAKFANITRTSAADYERLGSVIVALGNSSATTESDIVEMSTRLASAGRLAGLTETEIMALATAMSSVGIQAEAGGTAMTQTITAIEKAVAKGEDVLWDFAGVAGMSAAEFATMWKSAPAEALQKFIAGLGALDEQGESAVLTLETLGLTGIRQSNMLKSLGLAAGTMAGAINLANKAWKENTALAEEAGKRYATTESKLKMAKNAAELLEVAIGDQLTPALKKIAEGGTEAFGWAAEFVEENPWLVKAITAVTAAVGVFSAGLLAYTAVSKAAEAATAAFNAILEANPAVIVVTAIVALTTAVAALALTSEHAENSLSELNRDIEKSKKAYEETSQAMQMESTNANALMAQLEALIAVENKTALQKEQIAQIVAQLNTAVPELALAYDAEADALNRSLDATKAMMKAQRNQEEMTKIAERTLELEQQIARVKEERAKEEQKQANAIKKAEELRAAAANGELQSTRALTNSLNTLNMQASIYGDNVGKLAQQEKELQDETAELEARYQELSGTLSESNESASTASGGLESLREELNLLSASYAEVAASATESLSKQIGLFDEVSIEVERSIDDLIGVMDGQVAYFEQFAENLKAAIEMGVDHGLIAQLSDGSKESAEILAAIVEGGEEKIAELNEAFAKSSEAREVLIEQMVLAKADFDGQCADIEARAQAMAGNMSDYAGAYESGKLTMQGYIDGLSSMIDQAERVMSGISKGGASAPKKSPIAGNVVNGTHASGLDYVPFDGYIAELHKGERVLTAAEAQAYIDAAMPRVETPTRQMVQKGELRMESHLTINSPKQMQPSEIVREERNMLRRLIRNAR